MPPVAGAGVGMGVSGGFGIILLTGVGLVDEMTPLLTTGDHAVDSAPVGESTDITVVDEEVGLQLAGEMRIVVGGLLWIVTVGSIELHTALTTPLEGLLQELSFTTGPEHQTMTILYEHLQCLNSKRALLTNLRIFILDDRPVKIDSNYHNIFKNNELNELHGFKPFTMNH